MQPPESIMTKESLCEGIDVSSSVVGFEHTPGTRVVFGVGVVSQVGDICRALGQRRALVVTDSGILKAGHATRVMESIEAAGLSVTIFSDVSENPTTIDVAACVAVAQEAEIDIIVGVGGGSSMDTAKGANFILTNGGQMRDYWGVNKATKAMLPFVAVPTTAGTGSECQSFALIADAETHMKMACGDKKAAAKMAILDPELTLTQPRSVTAHTGIDALTHAIESAVSKKRNDTSFAYSKLAFALLNKGLESVLRDPGNLEARAQMQLGAAYAGTAIENSMLGAAHSAANPLSAHCGTVHGEAVGMMMPHVVRMNSRDAEVAGWYRELYKGDLAKRIEQLLTYAGMPHRLDTGRLNEALLPTLATEAANQWTAQFNPVAVGAAEFEDLYRAVWI
jgi:alcohol dehydrogenase